MATLYLMLGYPGAGKTTTALRLQELTGAVHLNSDTIRAELFQPPTFDQTEHDALYKEINQRTAELLKQGTSVIYDANLNRRVHRQEKYDLCRLLGAECRLLWVQTPKAVAKQRRIEEVASHHYVPVHESPASMFDRLVDVFEDPEADEPYIRIDGQKISPEYIKATLGL